MILLRPLGGGEPRQLTTSAGARTGIVALELARDGRWLAAAGENGFVRVWNMAGAEARLAGSCTVATSNGIVALALSADSQMLACGTAHYSVEVYRLVDGVPQKPPRLLAMKSMHGFDVAFGPDGRLFVTGGTPSTGVWDLSRPEAQERRLNTGTALTVAFAPDGKSWVTTGRTVVKVWAAGSDRLQHDWKVAASEAIFAPDSRHLASVQRNGLVYFFRLPTK